MGDEWLSEQLSSILLFPVPQDMIDYIKSITNERDLEDYLRTLLDFENPHHKRFLQELIHRRRGTTPVLGYRKNEAEQDYIAPKVEKKKKDKGNKPQGAGATAKKDMNFFLFAFSLWTLAVSSEAANPCVLRDLGDNKKVCVCNSTYCDTIDQVAEIPPGQYVAFVSTEDGLRLNKTVKDLQHSEAQSYYTFLWETHPSSESFTVDTTSSYQNIMGFGGAFTDSFGINLLSLKEGAQTNLMKSYFSNEGIEYNLCRVPISGTDFSTRTYTYDDGEPDEKLINFSLTKEDYKFKIPLILDAIKMCPKEIKLVAASWSPPPWMKTNNDFSGFGFLKTEYYDSYAKYIIKFLDEYKKNGVPIWAISTGNEPSNGYLPVNRFNSLGWTPAALANWTVNWFGPQLRNSSHNKTKILAFDDQRLFLPWWIELMVNADKNILKYVDGFAIHWYWDFLVGTSVVRKLHELYPDQFLLYTEASVGDKPWEKKVDPGSWARGEKYLEDIIQDINNWVTGWIDWNMALDYTGGPSWAKNYVDSPILVNATEDEFYKQPMFYALAHVSKFIERGASRLGVTPTESNKVLVMAVRNPNGRIVIVLLNKNDKKVQVSIRIQDKRWIIEELPPHAMATFLCSSD